MTQMTQIEDKKSVESVKSVVMKSVVAEFLLAKSYEAHGIIRRASNLWPCAGGATCLLQYVIG